MQVTEQFLTIQGEGRSVGKLAYFIRLAGCNLWCRWCDSMHAVDPSLFRGKTAPIDYAQIPSNCQLIVITGGEPTLFNLSKICEKILTLNPECTFEVESNATIFPASLVDSFNWNLSPKLKSSNQKSEALDKKRLLKLQDWSNYARKNPSRVIFKFVISSTEDLFEVDSLVEEFQIPLSLVYLMAQGSSVKAGRRSLRRPSMRKVRAMVNIQVEAAARAGS